MVYRSSVQKNQVGTNCSTINVTSQRHRLCLTRRGQQHALALERRPDAEKKKSPEVAPQCLHRSGGR